MNTQANPRNEDRMEPYFTDGQVSLYLGDCLDVLAELPDDSIDSIVTDPPYGLEFMGREWDTFKPSSARIRERIDGRTNPAEGKSVTRTPEAYVAGAAFGEWCEAWARECLRVLKPGGYLAAFGGTRTYHRLACGIENAGFEIRDSLHWLYGSGFPKSMDVSKAIDKAAGAEREVESIAKRSTGSATYDKRPSRPGGLYPSDEYAITAPATEAAKQWDGWGTALKPAHEPIVLARKPLSGTVAASVTEHGTGALNIDGCRVNAGSRPLRISDRRSGNNTYGDGLQGSLAVGETSEGRWPPNVLLTHLPDCYQVAPGSDEDDCAPGCPVAELDRQSGTLTSGRIDNARIKAANKTYGQISDRGDKVYGASSGGASRFFPAFRWQAKAPASERPRLEDGTAHPTVKPLELMRWLVRLVTPPGGTVGDFFAGSGTTGEACVIEGFNCILAEKDPSSAELIKTRLSKPIQPAMFGESA